MSTPESPTKTFKKKGMHGIGRDVLIFGAGAGAGWLANNAWLNHNHAIRTPAEQDAAKLAAASAAKAKQG